MRHHLWDVFEEEELGKHLGNESFGKWVPVGENVKRQALFCCNYSPEDKENGQGNIFDFALLL